VGTKDGYPVCETHKKSETVLFGDKKTQEKKIYEYLANLVKDVADLSPEFKSHLIKTLKKED